MTANGKASFGPDCIQSAADIEIEAENQLEDDQQSDIEREMSDEEKEITRQINLGYMPQGVAGFCEPDGENPFEFPPAETTSLEPQETSQRNVQDSTYRGRFLAGKESEHAATREAYLEMYRSPSNGHVVALDNCRKFAQFMRDKVSGEVKVMADSCKDRWCPMCASQKASYAKDSTKIYIESLKAPRFLTLTLKNNESDLKTQVEFLCSCFKTLRQRVYWKRHVTGGIWFLQVKRGKNSGCWHPHFHILLDGDWMEQERLSALWEQVTFGSPVIWINRIHDIDKAAKYVARYCARPAMLADMPLDDRIEIIEALFRKRLAGTFGTGKAVTLTPPKIEVTAEWNLIGYYDNVISKAKTNPAARAVLVAYNTYIPLTESEYEAYTGHPVVVEVVEYVPKRNPQLLMDFFNS